MAFVTLYQHFLKIKNLFFFLGRKLKTLESMPTILNRPFRHFYNITFRGGFLILYWCFFGPNIISSSQVLYLFFHVRELSMSTE